MKTRYIASIITRLILTMPTAIALAQTESGSTEGLFPALEDIEVAFPKMS